MPDDPRVLWDARRSGTPPEEAVAVVHRFLGQCRRWGTDREIPKILAALSEDPTPEGAAALHQWTTWVAFVDHALIEIEQGTLDRWFTDVDKL